MVIYLSLVKIDPNVKCVQVGVEGELLLQHGCFWEVKSPESSKSSKTIGDVTFRTIKVHIHPPSSKLDFKPCSLLKKQKQKQAKPTSSHQKSSSKLSSAAASKRLSPFYKTYIGIFCRQRWHSFGKSWTKIYE